MGESIAIRTNAIPDDLSAAEIYQVLTSIRTDLLAIQTWAAAHVHSGITTGASNSAVATTTVTIGTTA